MLKISNSVTIQEWEIQLSPIRAQGNGGQNVNKVASAIHLRFDIRHSSLPDFYKERLLALSDSRISKDGVIIIKAQQFRTQEQNKEDALNRLQALIKLPLYRRRSVLKRNQPALLNADDLIQKKQARSEKKQQRKKKCCISACRFLDMLVEQRLLALGNLIGFLFLVTYSGNNNMTIRQKLYFLGVIAILGIVALLGTSSHFENKSNDLNHAIKLVGDLEIRLLNLRRNEKDFLLRSNDKYLNKFDANVDKFIDTEKELANILKSNELPSSQQFKQDLLAYQRGFQNLVSAYQRYGLDSKSGLLAGYEQALLEAKQRSDHQQLLALVRFDSAVKAGLFNSDLLEGQYAPELIKTGKQLAAQKQVVGVAYDKGLLGETRALSHAVEEQFETFSTALSSAAAQRDEQMSTIKQVITALILVVIFALIWQISRSINTRVNSLLGTIRSISETNNMGLRSDLKGQDELFDISHHLNDLLDKLEHLISSTQEKSAQLTASTDNMHRELEGVMEQFHTQTDHTASMATAVQQMVATIGEISESTSVA